MEYSDDDPASVLTPAQRQYLLGEKELSESGERALKRRIHERYRAGLKDLTLLAEYSHLDELLVDDDRLESQLRSAVAFVYRAAEMADLEGDELIEAGVVEGRRGHAEVLLKQFREDPLSLTLQEVRELKSYGKISDEDLFPLFEDDPALVLDKDLSPTVSTFIDRGEDDDE